jgi:hypothetical protein
MYTAPGTRKYCNVCQTIEQEVDLQAMPTILETYTHFDRNKEREKANEVNVVSDSDEETEETQSNEEGSPLIQSTHQAENEGKRKNSPQHP